MEPGTPESPFARGGPGVRLASLAAAEQQREREAMNLKMEVAHLRERLHQRVGGDTTAIELEDENFTLRRALQDAQRALVTQREAADARHAKALLNVVRLDGAWKAGAAELSRAQQQMAEAQARADALEAQHASDAQQLQTLRDEAHALRQQVDALRADELQRADELKRQVQSAQQDAREQLAQLEERCAAADVKLAAAEQSKEQLMHATEQLRGELARAQSEVNASDERLTQAQAEVARLAQQVAAQQQQIEHIPQVHRTEYERLVREKEGAWQQREEMLAQQVRDAQLDATQARGQTREMQQLQRDVLALLTGNDSSSSSSDGSAGAREVNGEEVRTRVKREVHRAKLVALELEKAKVRIEGMERQLAKQAKCAQENSELRAENDRLKKKLATARYDRLDVNRTPVKTSRSLEKAKVRIESLEREVAHQVALAKQNDELRAANEKLRKDVEAARSEATEANRVSTSAALSAEEATTTIKSLEIELAKQRKVAAEENDELRRENARLRTDIEAARSESAEAQRASAASSLSFHTAQQRIEDMERQLAKQTTLAQENSELRAENARLKKEAEVARAARAEASNVSVAHAMPKESSESARHEPPWRTMVTPKDGNFGGKVLAARNESIRTKVSTTLPVDRTASVATMNQGGEGTARGSAWKRSVVKEISSATSDKKMEDVVTSRPGRAEAVTTAPFSLPVGFEARQMIERIQRGSTKLGNPAKQVDEVRRADSDTKTVPAATRTIENTEVSKVPANAAGSAGKLSLEERLAQLRARAEPLRAKRKLEAAEEQQQHAGGTERVRKIFGLNRAHSVVSAVRTATDRSTNAAASAKATTTEDADASTATSEMHSSSSSKSEESSKSKFRRVFVQSRYLNNVTGRRTDP